MAAAVALLVAAAIVGTAEAVDFASYMTCTDCVDAGFGWCPIRRTCGGFANTECGEGTNYVRPEYGASLLKEERKQKKGKKRADSELPDVEKVAGLESFTRTVAKGDGLWAVLFCAEWSDACKATRPEFEKAAKALRGVVRFAEVDAEADTDLAAEYGVTVFPTVLTFVSEKDTATGLKSASAPYAGGRTAAALVAHVKTALGNLLTERVGAAHAGSFKVAADPAAEATEQARIAADAAAAKAALQKAEAAAAAAKKQADEAAAAAAAAAKAAAADADAASAQAESGKKKKKKKGKKNKKKKAAFRPGTGEFVEPVTGGAAEVEALAKASAGHAVFVHVYDVKSEACSAAGEAFDAAASALRGMVWVSGLMFDSGINVIFFFWGGGKGRGSLVSTFFFDVWVLCLLLSDRYSTITTTSTPCNSAGYLPCHRWRQEHRPSLRHVRGQRVLPHCHGDHPSGGPERRVLQELRFGLHRRDG